MTNPPDRELAVFSAARQLPARERAAYLDEACAGDPTLRQRVEELLQASADAGAFLESPVSVPLSPGGTVQITSSPAEKTGDRIGHYKLLQQIGEGGCGVVYMAEQDQPVRRRVALKVIKLGMDTKNVIARFEAERQALALMDHPNIAKVLDAGATNTGRPYFVMELVRGIKITDYCDENSLSTKERLDLFIKVCQAIQHAHQKGVIHRDIKPSNILVTMNDGVPLPKVIDFGIAKATHGKLADQTLFTAFEQFIGTPAYMSPEQAEMNASGVDTRSDIYSLGVLLYELLTGQTPFDAKKLLQSGLDEIRRIIRQDEPARPSTCLSTMLGVDLTEIARHRKAEPPKLVHLVRGDLDWIVMKALEKNRARRYETASGFAADLQRHLNNEAVLARPPSNFYKFQKAFRRNKFFFIAAAAVTAALIIGLGIATWMFFQEQQARRQAEVERKTAETEAAKSQQVAQFLKNMLNGVGPSVALGRDTTMLKEILDKTAQQVGTDLTNQPLVEAELRTTLGDIYAALGAGSDAEAMQRKALDLRRKALGKDNLQVADSLERLGSVLNQEGKNDEAETTLREAIALRQRLQSSENTDIARCLNDLASVLERLNRLEEAETADREALAIQRKLLGNESQALASTLSHLGYVLSYQSRPKEGETVTREALAIQRKLLGNEHPDVALTLENLGGLLQAEGRLEEAEKVDREVVAIDLKVKGPDHPDIAVDLGDLGSVFGMEGKFAEAEAVDRKALAISRKPSAMNPPQDNPQLPWALYHLATRLVYARKDLQEARSLAEESVALYERHPDWSLNEERHALGTLGETLAALGETNGIEPLYRQHVQLARQSGDRRQICEMLFNLASYLENQNRLAESEACYEEMIQIRRTLAGPDVPYRIYDLRSLSGLLIAQKKFEPDETLLRQALAVARKYYASEPNRNEEIIVRDLAEVLDKRKQFAEARTLAQEAVNTYQSHPDWNPDERNTALRILGNVMLDSGDLAGAETFWREQLDRQRSESNNRDVIQSLGSLGTILARENKLPEAESAYLERLAKQRELSGTNTAPAAGTIKALADVLKKEGKTNESQALLHPAPVVR